jgi:transposase
MSRRKFNKEFKREAVRLVRSSDASLSQVARELGVRSGLLSAWAQMVDKEAKTGLKTAEQDELTCLRRDNDRLRMEVDILKKATAFFAKECK